MIIIWTLLIFSLCLSTQTVVYPKSIVCCVFYPVFLLYKQVTWGHHFELLEFFISCKYLDIYNFRISLTHFSYIYIFTIEFRGHSYFVAATALLIWVFFYKNRLSSLLQTTCSIFTALSNFKLPGSFYT